MAGLAPMMFGLSLDFFAGGYSIDSPTALWWKQLATAVVFGLGIATVLTLVFTPSMLALRIWVETLIKALFGWLAAEMQGPESAAQRDLVLRKMFRRLRTRDVLWETEPEPDSPGTPASDLRAAE